MVEQVAVDALGQEFRHRLMLLLDAGVLRREEGRDPLGAEKDQRDATHQQETDADVPTQGVDGGPEGIPERRAHMAVTPRCDQLCAALTAVPSRDRYP